MAEIVQSLFGVTPQSYQQAQQQRADAQAFQYAQMSPFQQANYAIGRGANMLGGALGGQDPELQRITARQQIAQQINPNDPASIQQGIAAMQQAGDSQGAFMLQDAYRKLMESDALVGQRTAAEKASLAQAGRERVQAEPEKVRLAQAVALLDGPKDSPEYNTAFATSLREQMAKPDVTTTTEERNARAFAASKGKPGTPENETAFQEKFNELISKTPTANIKEVGAAEGTRKPVYLDANTNEQYVYGLDVQGKQVRQPYIGGVDRTVSKVNVATAAPPPGETEFVKELGKLDAKRVNEALAGRENAIAAVNTFDQLSKLDERGLISGTFATGRVGATNFLNTLGLVAPAEVEKLARSENYQKVAGDAILATLGGKLGAGFSNEDRKFIQGLIPQLENSSTARRQLIDYMAGKNRAIIAETTRMENYARENKGLGGFTPNIPTPGAAAPAPTGTRENPIKLK